MTTSFLSFIGNDNFNEQRLTPTGVTPKAILREGLGPRNTPTPSALEIGDGLEPS
jgi:hypothetical protein